ncbi:MAG: UvrD-helicase domain-containing protein [Bacilli bacterium]|nr:UvrD-helicase domain-containing protein [Bacilli bacterium]MDD4547412.1 UvrD-helicase domain-containing protein [Bacilli bacterium]
MKLDNLNEQQLEAVTTTEGPLLVLAGAGSGKTKVLTTRIAYLITEKNVHPGSILAITFTNKAAKEMKSRVINILGPMAHEIQISTFHSFGLLIIKEHCEKLSYKRNFTILDSSDSLTMIKKVMKELNLDPKVYNPKSIKNIISSNKNELIDAEGYSKFVHTEFDEKVLEIFRRYEKRLFEGNSLDFDDLLMLPLVLFKKYPDILKEYQEKYKYILIDEYQDTNEAQYLLTKLISAKYQNICVVGDESQSIYSFRGANFRNILNFEKDYKNPKVILLERNYRSTKYILNVANDIIKNNSQRKDKNLWTDNNDGSKVVYHQSFSEKDEASFVVEKATELINEGISGGDIAVLYRTNAQSRNLEEAFLKVRLPYKVVGSVYFYNRKEIKDLIAYLKVIYNEADNINFLRVINVPKRGIGDKTIERLSNKAIDEETSLYGAIESGKELEFKKIIEDIKLKTENMTLTELVDYVLDKSGMRQELLNEKTIESEIRLENLEEFKTITKEFEERNGIISLEEFLYEISLVADVEEYKNNKDAVTLMTIHSAKGLEFDYVFIVGLEETIFPHSNSSDSLDEIEEERRLCYVAVTRAKEKLWLVNSRRRTIYGLTSQNLPSRFIGEINEENLEIDDYNPQFSTNDFSDYIDKTAEYKIGDSVMHDVFGKGLIVGIDREILTIAFSRQHGLKKLMKGHKSIKKG